MSAPLDVWLRLRSNDPDEIAEAEANTYADGDMFRVEWYLNSVGLVKSPPLFATYAEACAWLTSEGFEDYSS